MQFLKIRKINASLVWKRFFFLFERCLVPISGRVTPVLYFRNANETENNDRGNGEKYIMISVDFLFTRRL